MRNLIRKIAKRFGVQTWYSVSGVYSTSAGSTSYICCTIRMAPWIHSDNYRELLEYLKNASEGNPTSVSIMSISKLGI